MERQARTRTATKAGAAACAALVVLFAVAAGPAAALVDQPVRFEVTNKNDSRVACAADGATYTVRGHLVGPPGRNSVTLYLHGSLAGEATWRLDAAGYDHALEMARLGHASVTISRIGFSPSVPPNGYLTCLGSDADVAHQIVAKLRSGDYALGDGPGAPSRGSRSRATRAARRPPRSRPTPSVASTRSC